MITDIQRRQLETLEKARALCEAEGIITKVEGHGVLLLCLPVYGAPEAEQLLLQATDRDPRKGG
ncbi:hypothetical protein GCM10023213_19870 [Prosthecobacter algae]|uniref:Uncharacterized protein n=1 Tax=Prosthecobacter algae TaxID=1144682 RepID=A0ABP9P701_9BACT